jgi:thiamine monophosphate synthase
VSKPAGLPVTGLDEVARACKDVSIPVLAIGGITPERAHDVMRAGASGIAAIGFFIPEPGIHLDRHLEACVARLQRVFDACEAVS